MRFSPLKKFSLQLPLCCLLLGLASLSGAAAAQNGLGLAGAAPLVADSDASGLLELKQRLTAQTVRELRTSYNGDYGTTLLLASDAPVFYVALLNRKSLWRVLRFKALAPAEQAYQQFSQRSADWADDEIQLQALHAQSQALLRSRQESEARLSALNADVQIMQGEQARIAQLREATQSQVKASEVERRAYQIQLEQLKRNIRQLETELAGVNGKGAPAK